MEKNIPGHMAKNRPARRGLRAVKFGVCKQRGTDELGIQNV